jgi:hypothetical protein
VEIVEAELHQLQTTMEACAAQAAAQGAHKTERCERARTDR